MGNTISGTAHRPAGATELLLDPSLSYECRYVCENLTVQSGHIAYIAGGPCEACHGVPCDQDVHQA